MSEYRYPVTVEVHAWMNADGEILVEERRFKVALALEAEPPKPWAEDEDKYILARDVTTTCGVVRQLRRAKENSNGN